MWTAAPRCFRGHSGQPAPWKYSFSQSTVEAKARLNNTKQGAELSQALTVQTAIFLEELIHFK